MKVFGNTWESYTNESAVNISPGWGSVDYSSILKNIIVLSDIIVSSEENNLSSSKKSTGYISYQETEQGILKYKPNKTNKQNHLYLALGEVPVGIPTTELCFCNLLPDPDP